MGSITHITNSAGAVVQELAYDAWGRLREPATQEIFDIDDTPDLLLGRGFTGHEYLPWFGLYNMNARLYDPVLGRFLSPDPYVAAPDFTQDFNRYTYARNNPLKYTDKTGYWAGWDDVIAMLTGGLINWVTNGCKFSYEGLSYFIAGAIAGEATLYAPGAYWAIAAGVGSINSVIGQGFNEQGQFSFNNVDWGNVFGNGIVAGLTSYVGGEVGKSLHVEDWYMGIESPALRSWLTNTTTNTIIGSAFGGAAAELDNDPNTNFLNGAWNGFKMGFVTGTIGGISNAALYSQKNNVNFFTGKSNVNTTKYNFVPNPDGDNITLYRGTTGSETDTSRPLFVTDNKEYAQQYLLNGGQVIEFTIPRSTFNLMMYDGVVTPYKGMYFNGTQPYNEYKLNSLIKSLIINR